MSHVSLFCGQTLKVCEMGRTLWMLTISVSESNKFRLCNIMKVTCEWYLSIWIKFYIRSATPANPYKTWDSRGQLLSVILDGLQNYSISTTKQKMSVIKQHLGVFFPDLQNIALEILDTAYGAQIHLQIYLWRFALYRQKRVTILRDKNWLLLPCPCLPNANTF